MSCFPRVFFLAILASCGGNSDSGGPSPANDGGSLSCDEMLPLTIGHCVDGMTDEPCVNFEAEMRNFVPVNAQTTVQPIIGFQGSPMFVLAVQGEGIAMGENEDAALVELNATVGDAQIGGYQSRPVLLEQGGNVTAPQLYVVIFAPEEITGQTVTVTASVSDRYDNSWCGSAEFTAGELIVPDDHN